jgi:hypothetical protein
VLGYAESRNDIDLHIAPTTTHRVAGVVSGPKDALASLTLRLLPAGLESLGFGSETATALVDGAGRFTFLGVPDGSYLLDGPRAVTELNMTGTNAFDGPRPPAPPGYGGSSMNSESVPTLPGIDIATRTERPSNVPNFWVRTPIAVSADMDSVALSLRPMGSLSGSVSFNSDPSATTQRPQFYVISLDAASGSPGLGLPRAGVRAGDGDQFSIAGLAPAPYFLRYNGAPGWLIQSITWGGRDYTSSPFDALTSTAISDVAVVVTNAVPVLGGVVTGPAGGPSAGATVLVFPADRGRWFNYGLKPAQFVAVAVGSDGTYDTRTLPAGEYFVVSLTGPPTDWMEPGVLDALARVATRVTLSWGRASTVDLHIVEIRR